MGCRSGRPLGCPRDVWCSILVLVMWRFALAHNALFAPRVLFLRACPLTSAHLQFRLQFRLVASDVGC